MRRTPLVTALLVCAAIGFSRAGSAQDAAARPTILNVTMSTAGDLVTITGTGFGPAPVVTIDGQPVPVLTGATDTQVTVVAPAVLLTAPGTYRLTLVDSVRQVGEVFVVASRAEPVPAVSLTTGEAVAAPITPGVAILQPLAAGVAVAASSGASGEPVGTSVVEDPGSPFRTALGFQALAANTTGTSNTATGYQALQANTTGSQNTASGRNALYSNIDGWGNTASGFTALASNTAGIYNTASGSWALQANTTGGANTASGYTALYSNITGTSNTATGHQALQANTTGSQNTASGVQALSSNTTGIYNTALGWGAGSNATTGRDNLFLGANVLGTASDTNTIRLGLPYDGSAGQNNTFIAGIRGTPVTGGFPVVIDANGQLGSTGTIDAPGFLRSTSLAGIPTSGAGIELAFNSGSGGIGVIQAYDRTASAFRTLFLDGATLALNAQGSGGSVGIGTSSPAARLDVVGAIRASGLAGILPFGAGIELLYNAGSGGIGSIQAYDRSGSAFKTLFLDGSTLVLNVGSGGKVGIGTATPSHPLQMASGAYVSEGGVWTNASSRALKDQIADLPADRALDAFAHLKPVTFVYRANPAEAHVGFIAEDVPDLVATADRKSLAAMDIVGVLTKVAQEQQAKVAVLTKEAREQQDTIADLQARLARLEALLTDAATAGGR